MAKNDQYLKISGHHQYLDITGQKYGRLTVISFHSREKSYTKWLCKCECGNQTITAMNYLRTGKTKSCGCICKEKPNAFVHGFSNNRFYRNWLSMKARCYNSKTSNFYLYGGRGIKISDRWLKFENFKDDMYKSYLEHIEQFGKNNTSIDRIDNNGNYELNNCKWTTNKEQGRNKRNNHLLTFKGETLPLSQWAEKINISSKVLRTRILRDKWSTERAITTPIKIQK